MTILLVIVGVLGVSASGPLIAAFPGVPVLAMALWRNFGATAVLVAPTLHRDPTSFRRMGRREWAFCSIAGVCLALHFVCFMYAVRMTSVAAATALVCIQGVWIVVFQRLRGVSYTRMVFLGIALSITGVVIITGFDLGQGREAIIGDLLAILGGMLAGAYTLAGSVARRTMSTGAYASVCYAVTSLVLLAICLLAGERIWGFDAWGWFGIVALTVCSQLLGHTALNHLLSILGPLTVSTLILLEIPGAAFIAALMIGQLVPAGTILGLIVILGGLVLVVRGQAKPEPPTVPLESP
ncbi:DMT family transporter [Glutamicibacter sp. V16R2B1]|uniref:DMT family transporter n=1 Tax=Glutamicibacter sp. V16R2B1 TaxID=2036207 RepID=UPI0010FE5036|nr:DMT family transporter [Glutamicibacter sp. V16R2B1]TLK51592.1 DMT family transporter [Glutamicibacter sp. V16R2B1]